MRNFIRMMKVVMCVILLSIISVGRISGQSYCQTVGDLSQFEIVSPTGEGVDWHLTSDSAVQYTNGEKSYLIMPSAPVGNISMRGNVFVSDSIDINNNGFANPGVDDDLLGMVTLQEYHQYTNGGNVDSVYLRAIWFSWKKNRQVCNNMLAEEGFRCLRIDGTFLPSEFAYYNSSDGGIFWGDDIGDPRISLLGSNFADNLGWEHNMTYNFEISYTPLRSRWYVNGVEKLDIILNEGEGCFEPGQIGFANMSQCGSIYSQISYKLMNIDFSYEELSDVYCLYEMIPIKTIGDCPNIEFDVFDWTVTGPNGFYQTTDTLEPVFQFDTPGNYYVSPFAQDANGCSDTAQDIIHILSDVPQIPFGQSILCPGQVKVFNLNEIHNWPDSEYATYLWGVGGDETFEIAADTIGEYNTPTYYPIYVQSRCSKDTLLIGPFIRGKATEIVSIEPTVDTLMCHGTSLLTTVSAVGTNVGYSPSSSFEIIADYTKNIPITVSGACGIKDAAVKITVIEEILTSGVDKWIICEGDQLFVDDIFSEEGGDPQTKNIQYFWDDNQVTTINSDQGSFFITDTVAKTTYTWIMKQSVQDRCMSTEEISTIWIEHKIDSILVEDRSILLATDKDTLTIEISEGDDFPWLHMQPWGSFGSVYWQGYNITMFDSLELNNSGYVEWFGMCEFYQDLYIKLSQIPCVDCEDDVLSIQAVPNPVPVGGKFQIFTYNPNVEKSGWIYGEELAQKSTVEVYTTSGQLVWEFTYQTGGEVCPLFATGTYVLKTTNPQGEVVTTKIIFLN